MDACFLVSESSLPFWPGAWVDQPAWLVEAYKIYKIEQALVFKQKTEKVK